ncbi:MULTISPECIES: hypothetical protein [unclassified Rhizobium]|uniref:hypothetical protein n=1 Tax=unclassified Rhizobium TaxID=2613769 RepID=UPI000713A31B|nr:MULTISPECIES: hypothetical protein [unclassified Rhizobium]KQS84118.1 hypothetical protein ASG50_29965 [Rhizobium sp. Leaf386]KQT03219.1 hypothetical protein ASG42_24740 [Rhizobium sp. Leaf391]KQU08386.1 hypothetical protein ASG68_22620 [Rhizobium sp. Leaf453]
MKYPLSPAASKAQDAVGSDDYEVVLIRIRHPDLVEDILISSDPNSVVSYEPYMRGTVSPWLAEEGEENTFLFIGIGFDLPDDVTDAAMQGALIIDVLDSEIANILTSTIEPAVVDMCTVMRSSPDFIERQFLGHLMSGAEGDGGAISLSFNRRHVLEEPCPADRTTKERFPGLHP